RLFRPEPERDERLLLKQGPGTGAAFRLLGGQDGFLVNYWTVWFEQCEDGCNTPMQPKQQDFPIFRGSVRLLRAIGKPSISVATPTAQLIRPEKSNWRNQKKHLHSFTCQLNYSNGLSGSDLVHGTTDG